MCYWTRGAYYIDEILIIIHNVNFRSMTPADFAYIIHMGLKVLWFYLSYPIRWKLKNKIAAYRLEIGNKSHIKPKARRRGQTSIQMMYYMHIAKLVKFVERWTTDLDEYMNGYKTPDYFKDPRLQY